MEPSSPDHVHDGHHHIKLACQACQRKKIKCDRTIPCTPCQRSSLECLPSTRKPRARHVGKKAVDSELRSRISKLESLVESLSGDVEVADDTPPEQTETTAKPRECTSPTMGKYIGGPFWATLTSEVQALRDALEEEASDDDPTPELSATRPPTNDSNDQASVELLICPGGSIYVMPGALPEPPPLVARQLYDIFLHNADPVFKVLHRPTLKRWLEGRESYLGQPADAPPNKALKAAMWFAAVTTLRDADCLARFQTSRSDLLQQYRRHIDIALAQADLVNTTNLATLQAFVLYTASSRITDLSRRAWTMTGLIVRIAQGMGLHHELDTDSPYMKEIKRRLWHQIRVLDAFAAVDRATELLISLTSFDTPLPSNVNDTEFDEFSTAIPNRKEGLSDMTFNLMAHLATTLTMRLLKPEINGSKGETWQQRLDSALSLGKELREKYLQYCDLSKPFHRFIYAVGGSMSASSVLRAVRPMQRHVSSIPPRVDSVFVLQLAVNSLRESEATHQDPEAAGWRWIFWVQWHALAVALAGLCSIRDTELAKTAWSYVEKAYERHSRQVADTKSGMLWKPIEKLYKKASAYRDGESSPSSTSPPDTSMSDRPIVFTQNTPTFYAQSNGQAQLPPGGMPTSGIMNGSMGLPDGFGGLSPLQGGDFSWEDWENIMSDIHTQGSVEPLDVSGVDLMNSVGLSHDNITMGDLQQLSGVQGDWPCPLHHRLA